MIETKAKTRAFWMVLLSGVFWGSAGVFVRYFSAAGFSAQQITLLRIFTTAVLQLILVLVYDASLLRIRLRDLWCFIGTSMFSVVLFSVCYYRTIALTTLSVAAVLLYTAPTIVMLLSALFFGEKITRQKVIAVVLAFAGCVLVSGLGTESALPWRALLIGLGSGLGYALYSIFSRFALNRGYHSFTIIFYTFFFGSLGCALLASYGETARMVAAAPTLMPMVVLLALITGVLPYALFTLGLREIETSRASIITSVEPVTATLLGAILYLENPGFAAILGMLLVLFAIVVLNRKPKQTITVLTEEETALEVALEMAAEVEKVEKVEKQERDTEEEG